MQNLKKHGLSKYLLLPSPLLERVIQICILGNIPLEVTKQVLVDDSLSINFKGSDTITPIKLTNIFDENIERFLSNILRTIQKDNYDSNFYKLVGANPFKESSSLKSLLLNHFAEVKNLLYFKESSIGFNFDVLTDSNSTMSALWDHKLDIIFKSMGVYEQCKISKLKINPIGIDILKKFSEKTSLLPKEVNIENLLSDLLVRYSRLDTINYAFSSIPEFKTFTSILLVAIVVCVMDQNTFSDCLTIQPQHIAEAVQYYF